ncbi:transmembrane protein 154 isoform X1 [Triplophysa rosa]|uniref:Transmembrane protein 154 n=1 Tax=Triplophysa rosa TaxID=992332 RepID=A0A9W7WZG3_TRIRA|nr:transmembrane protein 154 isoform X1 [Triplophysa rosa]KAI7810901.1 putative transmembrane protein 154 [Triplophysa rosa]
MTLILLLFLAVTASWTGPVQCEDEGKEETENASEDSLEVTTSITETNAEDPENHENAGSGDYTTQGADNADRDSSASRKLDDDAEINPTDETETDTGDLYTVIIISLVLTLIIIPVIVCGVVIYCRRRTKVVDEKEDHYLDNEDHEKVPMPMFEDDIPSVMELEMEDLENWMSKGNSCGAHAVLAAPS